MFCFSFCLNLMNIKGLKMSSLEEVKSVEEVISATSDTWLLTWHDFVQLQHGSDSPRHDPVSVDHNQHKFSLCQTIFI